MNRTLNNCFVCDQPATPSSGHGSLNQKSSVFQKLNIKINQLGPDLLDVMCGNCTVIMNEIDLLRNEMNLLSYLVQRQIRRKYKGTCNGPDEQPNIDLLNKLDLIAVKSFKLLSNDYVCIKCDFKTPFQDALVPHFKFHGICEKSQEPQGVASEDDLIEYDSDYEEQFDERISINYEFDDLVVEEHTESVVYTELNYPESQKQEHLEFMCPWCVFKNSDYENLVHHMNEMHPDGEKTKFSSCLYCGGLLEPNGTCTHQKIIDKGFKPKHCSKCHEQFYMDHLLYDHYRRIHLKCDICNKTFSNFKILRHHEYTHKDGATYKCTDCDKKFKTRAGLIYHLPKHTGNYLSYCSVCNKGFMGEAFLEEHMRIHTKVYKYVCDICGTKFIHNSTYRLHRRWHDNPFPFECTDCGKKFKHTSKLAVHRRREHTGERPYKCDVCQKSFYESTSLRTHQRSHAQVVTYKCHTCNVSFNSKTIYIQHMQKNHSKRSNFPKKSICEYKVVLKPGSTSYQETEVDESNKSTEPCEADESFQNNLNKDISNDDSSLVDSFIYKILL